MRHSVTTPGGFFIGIGGIAASLVLIYLIFWAVRKPSSNDELLPQQIALKLAPDPKETSQQVKTDVIRQTETLLKEAASKYNGGQKPDISELEQLRGVVRFQKAREVREASAQTLNAESSVKGPNQKPLSVLEAAKQAVAADLLAKKPAASTVKVDLAAPAQVVMSAAQMPNLQGGGAHTVTFPEIKPPTGTEPK